MLLTSAFSKENSAISLEEWVLVFKVFTLATRKLRVNLEDKEPHLDEFIQNTLNVDWALNSSDLQFYNSFNDIDLCSR